jgi:hypothetical protein
MKASIITALALFIPALAMPTMPERRQAPYGDICSSFCLVLKECNDFPSSCGSDS